MKINVPKLTYCNAETPFCSCSIRTDHIVSINAKKADERYLAGNLDSNKNSFAFSFAFSSAKKVKRIKYSHKPKAKR